MYTGLWVDQTTLIRDRTVTAHEDVICDRLPENFDFEHVRDDLLCLPIDVWMYECDVVVACDDVSEGR